MKNFEVVRNVKKSVEGLLSKMVISPELIAMKTARFAYLAKGVDVTAQVPQAFQGEMSTFIDEMRAIFSGFATNQNDVGPGMNAASLAKSIDVKVGQHTFAKWAQTQIGKAIDEKKGGDTVAAIKRLRKLDACIQKMLDEAITKGASFEDDSPMSFSVENDPQALMWRQVDGSIVDVAGKNVAPSQFAEAPTTTFLAIPVPSTETEGSFLAEANGNMAPSNAVANPGDANNKGPSQDAVAVAAVLEAIRDTVTKYETDIPEVRWGLDLTRKDFMEGIHKEDFGRDSEKVAASSWANFRR